MHVQAARFAPKLFVDRQNAVDDVARARADDRIPWQTLHARRPELDDAHFSPGGRWILGLTRTQLFVFDGDVPRVEFIGRLEKFDDDLAFEDTTEPSFVILEQRDAPWADLRDDLAHAITRGLIGQVDLLAELLRDKRDEIARLVVRVGAVDRRPATEQGFLFRQMGVRADDHIPGHDFTAAAIGARQVVISTGATSADAPRGAIWVEPELGLDDVPLDRHRCLARAAEGEFEPILRFAGGSFDKVPEVSRRGRAFTVWAVLRALGRDGVADLVIGVSTGSGHIIGAGDFVL